MNLSFTRFGIVYKSLDSSIGLEPYMYTTFEEALKDAKMRAKLDNWLDYWVIELPVVVDNFKMSL